MPGWYLEDQQPERRYTTASRTVGEYEVSSFAALTGDFNPMHTDREFAAASPYGQLIAHGALGFSLAVGLINRTGIMDETAIAFLGMSDWRFVAPILLADTVHVTGTVASARESASQPGGIVAHKVELINQRHECVQSGTLNFLIRRRPVGG